ncbi:MAG TPA: glycosyltransferase [Saprospiraceae bacterium]|nr:glycosyltransferase [Saprospiraceae bacterium]
MTFDITVPVLDEEATLRAQIRELHTFVKQHFTDPEQWRIVIADNGSTDATPELAKALSEELAEVTFLQVPKKGVGIALKTSWTKSNADIVGYMDLDLATDLSHFLEAYRAIALEDFDLVYGTRLHPKAKVINRPLKREISSRGFNLILKGYLGVNFSDGMCGFKFLKRQLFPSLFKYGAQNDGWFFSTELLTVAEWLDYRIYELPVKWTDDPQSSKVQIIPLAKKYLRAMQELKQQKRKWDL